MRKRIIPMNKEILISSELGELRVAVVEDTKLEEYYIERPSEMGPVGNIYKGRVSSIIPGIQAAFVDVGLGKNGFLYVSDIIASEELDSLVESTNGSSGKGAAKRRPRRRKNKDLPQITTLLKENQEILVQVAKEQLGTKGVRLTSQLSLPGRYLVYLPHENRIGISRKINDPKERFRIKEILAKLKGDKPGGFIVRTAALGAQEREISRDYKYLTKLWSRIQATSARAKESPSLVHEEMGLAYRIIRDYVNEEVDKIIIDSKLEYRKISSFVSGLIPGLKKKIEFYRGEQPLFEIKKIERQIRQIYERKVQLKSGAYLIIEPTEGLVVIDVNSGKFVKRKNLEDTAFRTNREAAKEVARQIRLRDLGGIVVLDFIDMETEGHRREIFSTMIEAVKRDRAKTHVSPISNFGLIEMTRQRMRKSLQSRAYQSCPYCQSRGLVKSALTMAIQATREAKQYLQTNRRRRRIELIVHPDVGIRLNGDDKILLRDLERKFRARISVSADSNLHVEEIKVRAL